MTPLRLAALAGAVWSATALLLQHLIGPWAWAVPIWMTAGYFAFKWKERARARRS